jgi:hypothetical protein
VLKKNGACLSHQNYLRLSNVSSNIPKTLTDELKMDPQDLFLNQLIRISEWQEWEFVRGEDTYEYLYKLLGANDHQRRQIERKIVNQSIHIDGEHSLYMRLYSTCTIQMIKMGAIGMHPSPPNTNIQHIHILQQKRTSIGNTSTRLTPGYASNSFKQCRTPL